MKNHVKNSYVLLCTLVCLVSANLVKSQQTLTQINGWNAYVHLPANYNNTTISYPTIIFFPGLGEIGTNASAVIAQGPGAYINQGWNGNVVANGSTVEFIVISLQPSAAYPNEISLNQKIQTIKSLYRVNSNKLYLTGLSHGGWCSTTFVTGDPLGGPYTYASQIAAVVEVQGVMPDDNSPYPTLFDNYANAGGRLLGFEQAYDNRGMPTRVNRMNATKPNSAIYVQTNFGNGGHCCWNQYYGGQGVQPGIFMLDGVNQNLYQWLAKQSLGTQVNQAPIVNAGADKLITLPTSSTTLNGSATDADGTISSYAWTQISGPNTATISLPLSPSTNISGLTGGTYVFKLAATDNLSATSSGSVNITVGYSPSNLTITSNSPSTSNGNASLTSTLGPNYNIISTKWSKLSAPGAATKKIVFIGSSTTAGYGTTGYVSGGVNDSSYATLVLKYYQNLGLISTITGVNLGTSSTDVFDGQPSWYVPTGSQRSPLAGKNITAALALSPNIVIVNYPSNSYDFLSITEVMQGFRRIKAAADAAGVTTFITTTQPRIGFSPSEKLKLIQISDSIRAQFPNNFIEFYKPIADGITGNFKTAYNLGDGVHTNDAGHRQLFNRVVEANVFKGLVSSSSSIATATTSNTNITGITGAGSHRFQVSITDDRGLSASSISTVTYSATATTCNQAAPIVYTISQTSPGEIYITNASTRGWKGGDTLLIPSGTYSIIQIDSFGGDPCKDIIIKNSGGQVLVNGPMRFGKDVHHVQILGNGSAGITYGFKVINSNFAFTRVNHFTARRIEVGPNPGGVGIYGQQPPYVGQPETHYPNYVNRKITIDSFYIHNVAGEGMYLGNTAPDADPYNSFLIPQRLDSVTISNCIVDTTGWDGIQLSNARDGNLIYNNTVRNFGTLDIDGQRAGIISGGNTNSKVYNNIVTKGTGNGIQIFGYGAIKIYGNTIDSVGTTASNVNGEQSIYGADYLNSVETNPKQAVEIYSNQINRPKVRGAIFFYETNNNAENINVHDNKFCIPGATATWQNTYFTLPPIPINNNNVLFCPDTTANQAPTADAGSNISITLPVSTTALSGIGTDPDGTIASYAWAKISGPAAGTLTNVNTANATAASLVQGLYSYQLTVTDNAGITGRDTVNVNVNAATLTLLPAVNPANTVNGTDFKYYEGNWSVLPDFASLNPIKTGFANNFNISLANKTTQFGFSFTGYINVPVDGQYKFYTSSDDGSKLYIDNVLTVSNDGLHGRVEKSGLIGLKAGKHAIKGLFFQQGGGQVFIVSYEGTGITKQAIPSSSLYRENARPVSNAGANKTLTLPANSTTLTGSGTDTDGTIASFAWVKISGPAIGTLTNAATANAVASSLLQGVYSYQLTVTDNAGATGTDTVNITVNPTNNQLPIATAGNNQTLILPTNTAVLNGTGTDTDGTIISYQWTKISGIGGAISNAAAPITFVTGLVEGTYQYQLKIKDNSGATASAITLITVDNVPKKIIRVNIFGGTNPYTNPKWNNWNNKVLLTSNKFSYEDLSLSNVNVSSTSSGTITDNGTNYASTSTVCPPEVLRYNSYNTSYNTLTFNGLNPAKKYSFEFYASRANSAGNSTVFQIIDNLDTITTNANINDYASFFNISPDNAGKVKVTISRIGTYHYLAGFTITEPGDAVAGKSAGLITEAEGILPTTSEATNGDAIVYPNPFKNNVSLNISTLPTGPYLVQFTDAAGKIVLQHQQNKQPGATVANVQAGSLKTGVYYLQIISKTYKKTYKIIKL